MDFLEVEIRCEFKVEKWRKKLWLVELELLDVFIELCDKYKINYFFIAGSALGVVRHSGFIPWDDDIDIGMLRTDFNKFLSIPKEEFPSDVFLSTGTNEQKRFDSLVRLRNSNSTGVIGYEIEKDCNKGVFIELYPFDRVPDNKVLRYVQAFKSRFFYHSLFSYCYPKKGFVDWCFRTFVRLNGYNRLIKKFEKNCSKYNGRDTKCVDTPALPMYQKQKIHHFLINDVKETQFGLFENRRVRIPIGNDSCLKKAFGNYMELPPVEERGRHHNNLVFYDPFTPYSLYTIDELKKKFLEVDKSE